MLFNGSLSPSDQHSKLDGCWELATLDEVLDVPSRAIELLGYIFDCEQVFHVTPFARILGEHWAKNKPGLQCPSS